jgi:basic membrane protein A and related proteins
MTVTKFGLALAGLAFSASAAFAQQAAFKPAVVYDLEVQEGHGHRVP